MGNVSQIYGIVNDAVSDFMGKTAVRVKDSSSFVDLGRSLADLGTQQNPYAGYDSFYGALAARIAKTEVFIRLYKRADRGVIQDYQNFGAFVQKIYTKLAGASSNPTWSLSNGQNPPTITGASPYDVTNTVAITTALYGLRGTWTIEIVKPYHQIKEAFLSESAMMAFIDSIDETVSNSMEIDKEALENIAVATSMADCIAAGHATNVLAKYNATLPAGATAATVADCRQNKAFLAYANKYIDDFRGYIKKPSTKYNTAGHETFTPSDNTKLEVLTEFASSSKFFLESDTYHNELVTMEGYSEVPYWQSPGTAAEYDFTESSKINVKHDKINSGVAVEQSGIIAFLRDDEAVKAYFGDIYEWTVPNPRQRSTIMGVQAETGYAVDKHANAWVFYIADPAPTPEPGGDDEGGESDPEVTDGATKTTKKAASK